MSKPIDIEVHSARIGKCMRSLGFHILGKGVPTVAPPPSVIEIYKAGERYEILAKKQLKKMGYKLRGSKQKKELLLELEAQDKEFNIYLAGNTDDSIYYEEKDMWIPLEIKSMNQWRMNHVGRTFTDWNDKLKFTYGVQMGSYRHLYDTPYIAWALKEKDDKDPKDSKLKLIIIKEEELPDIDFITERVLKASKVLTGRDIMPGANPDCKYCSYNGKVCLEPQIKYHPVKSVRKKKLKPLKKVLDDDIPTMEEVAKLLTNIQILKEDLSFTQKKYDDLMRVVKVKYGSKVKVKKGKKK
jgi:hypothetical protein